MFAGKEGDGQINQVPTIKRSFSVYKLTGCTDCAIGHVMFAGKEGDGKINQVQTTKRSVSVY